MASIPAVHALERRYGTRGLRVVGVTRYGEDAQEQERVASVIKEHGMTGPTFLDPDGKWSEASGLGHAPSFLVIGKDGKAVYRYSGKLTEGSPDFDELAKAVEAALGAS